MDDICYFFYDLNAKPNEYIKESSKNSAQKIVEYKGERYDFDDFDFFCLK